jgi:hypothetical protein
MYVNNSILIRSKENQRFHRYLVVGLGGTMIGELSPRKSSPRVWLTSGIILLIIIGHFVVKEFL